MGSFRFVHTGDIHLDSPLKGLFGQQGAAAERVRTATRAALDNLISHAIEEQVAFVIIAGDLYDGDWRDYQTGLFLSGRWVVSHRPESLSSCSTAIMMRRARSRVGWCCRQT